MSDVKKPGLFDDVEDLFNGISNVVTGKVFSKEAWTKVAAPKTPEVKAPPNDDAEEIEEVRTVRRRKGGTFASAPKPKAESPAESPKPAGDGDSKPVV